MNHHVIPRARKMTRVCGNGVGISPCAENYSKICGDCIRILNIIQKRVVTHKMLQKDTANNRIMNSKKMSKVIITLIYAFFGVKLFFKFMYVHIIL